MESMVARITQPGFLKWPQRLHGNIEKSFYLPLLCMAFKSLAQRKCIKKLIYIANLASCIPTGNEKIISNPGPLEPLV